MKYPVRLFLGNEEVEFSQPPQILFNYSETELTNPTIVKNSYSKTVTIEGTPKNNRIFGHIYDMQRIQGYDGTIMGSSFNPLVKTDFTLYYNSSIYESGYFKLDEVRRNDNNIEYDITLYGGLGDYFYNLSFREDGNSMELSDLKYEVEDWAGELGFQINKEAVKDAWLHIWQPSSKWDTINFAPCYNGLPSSLSADKYLINTSGMTVGPFADRANTGYIIGTSKEEHTEWESFDLRSYLQRPVIRVKEVLKAIANPVNNGGYTVNLDEEFFTPENPYYWDSWMTLPLLTELDVPATLESALTVTAITLESRNLYHLWDGGATATNVQVDVDVKFTPSDGYTGDSIYLSRQYDAKGGATLQSRFAKYYIKDCTVMIQMIGYNESGQMSTFSNLYELITPRKENILHQPTPKWYSERFVNAKPDGTSVSNITPVYGKFTKKNGEYVFTDMSGNTQTLRFTFPSNSEFTKLKLKIVPFYKMYREYTWGHVDSVSQEALIDTWSQIYRHSNSWQDMTLVQTLDRVVGTVSYEPVGATGTTTSFEGFYSNRTFTKKDLLTVGITPAQFLLSYAKMFGLYFIKDVESKTIDILTRHNFYLRDEVVNINDLVDKGSDIKITPNSPQYQYYDFGLEQVESEAADSYRKTYGNDYGTQVVNTGYQYEKEHKHLLDGNAFKGGINVMEKNKYFLKPTQGIPCLVFNGFSYTYEDSTGGTTEVKVTPQPMAGIPLNSDHKYYDFIAKPQFHTANNEASDGAFVLLFFSGNDYSEDGHGLKLTDDLEHMYTLNDGQPCWLITMSDKDASGNTIALTVDRYPIFTRDIYNFTGYISNSFDLGTPLTTYVPDKYVSDWQNIYSRGWKSYISDLYDVNTRILRCRCLLRERPNPDWMRRFYWFDNSYWRLNQIKDWDISSFDTTEMEFIKVQDISDYDNVLFSYCPVVEGSVEMNQIDNSAHTLTGRIYVSDGTSVSVGDVISVTYSDGTHEYWSSEDVVSPLSAYGTTNVQITINIPANTGLTRTISIPLEDGCDKWHYIKITQGAEDHIATITPTTLSFDYTGGTKYLSVSDPSHHGWTIQHDGYSSGWTTFSPVSGIGNATISVTAQENHSKANRAHNLRFQDNTISTYTSVLITQAKSETLSPDYLTFTAVNSGSLKLHLEQERDSEGWMYRTDYHPNDTLQYRVNDGSWTPCFTNIEFRQEGNYTEVRFDEAEINVSSGDTVQFRGTNLTGFVNTTTSKPYYRFTGTLGSRFDVSGDLSSLIYGDSFNSYSGTTGNNKFCRLFYGTYLVRDASELVLRSATIGHSAVYEEMFVGSGIVNAPILSVTTLSNGCYLNMFSGCTNLVDVPALPATILAEDCYAGMFGGCTSLTGTTVLPAMTLADGCYRGMFENCTSIRVAQEIPATTAGYRSCEDMFRGCTSLTSAPSRLASSVDERSYYSMFKDCTSLTTSPVLPAKTLATRCYMNMFQNCSALNNITCFATNTGATDCTDDWVYGVASAGTFVKSAAMTGWTIGVDGIPVNWTVQDYDYATPYITPTSRDWRASGGTKSFTIWDSDQVGWNITNIPNWLTLSETSGYGNAEIEATASTNTSSARSDTFYFNSLGTPTAVTVSQTARYGIAVSPVNLFIGASGATATINVTQDAGYPWYISTGYNWLSDVTGVSGIGIDYPQAVSFQIPQNEGSQRRGYVNVWDNNTASGTKVDVDVIQYSGTPTPTTFAHINFTYGDVDAPETGNWDYVIYYSESGAHPAGEGMAMANIGGVLLYPGSLWNPSQASNWEIYQPFSGDTFDTSGIDLPQSFAGQTIYIQAELGNPELGYAVESQTVSVTIPSGGGEVNVTIPQI